MEQPAVQREGRGIGVDEALAIVLALPGVEQRAYGTEAVALKVRGKGFAYLNEVHHRAMIKAVRAEHDALVATDPEAFQPAWSSGQFAWIEVRLAAVARDEFAELITEAWRLTAPKRLIADRGSARVAEPPRPGGTASHEADPP
jgi:hypothetical protein